MRCGGGRALLTCEKEEGPDGGAHELRAMGGPETSVHVQFSGGSSLMSTVFSSTNERDLTESARNKYQKYLVKSYTCIVRIAGVFPLQSAGDCSYCKD